MSFRGRLYDLGDYPGVVLSRAGGTVHAELYRIERPAILAVLDDFELYRPAEPDPYDPRTGRGSLYLRKVVAVERTRAYLYVWNGPTFGAPQVETGDWKHG